MWAKKLVGLWLMVITGFLASSSWLHKLSIHKDSHSAPPPMHRG